jgi:hypothetical protein
VIEHHDAVKNVLEGYLLLLLLLLPRHAITIAKQTTNITACQRDKITTDRVNKHYAPRKSKYGIASTKQQNITASAFATSIIMNLLGQSHIEISCCQIFSVDIRNCCSLCSEIANVAQGGDAAEQELHRAETWAWSVSGCN